MSREETEPEGSKTAGGCLLTGASLAVGMAVFVYSRDVFVLVVWALGGLLLWRAARRRNKIDNPSPGRGSEGVAEIKPQFSIVQDLGHPNRWRVNQKETGTS